MSHDPDVSRRDLLRWTVGLGLLGSASVLAPGCAKQLSCDDVSALSTPDTMRRKSMKYVAVSPKGPEESCRDCKFFTAGAEGQCGTCSLVPGPIHPDGRCNLWAAT